MSSLPYCIFLVCLGPPSSLLFISSTHISHRHPPSTTKRLYTAKEVNNIGVLHIMYNGYIYTYITKSLLCSFLFYTSSTLLGRPADPDHSCWEHFCCLKGLSHWIFKPVNLAYMDASRPECELLQLLKLLWCSFSVLYQTFSEIRRISEKD